MYLNIARLIYLRYSPFIPNFEAIIVTYLNSVTNEFYYQEYIYSIKHGTPYA